MSERARLPNRRASSIFELEVAGLRYTASISQFPDGRVGEIFLQNHKPGSQSDSNARDAAVAASLALSRFVEALLFQVRPRDPLTLALAASAVLLFAPLAVYTPVRRATRVECTVALREA